MHSQTEQTKLQVKEVKAEVSLEMTEKFNVTIIFSDKPYGPEKLENLLNNFYKESRDIQDLLKAFPAAPGQLKKVDLVTGYAKGRDNQEKKYVCGLIYRNSRFDIKMAGRSFNFKPTWLANYGYEYFDVGSFVKCASEQMTAFENAKNGRIEREKKTTEIQESKGQLPTRVLKVVKYEREEYSSSDNPTDHYLYFEKINNEDHDLHNMLCAFVKEIRAMIATNSVVEIETYDSLYRKIKTTLTKTIELYSDIQHGIASCIVFRAMTNSELNMFFTAHLNSIIKRQTRLFLDNNFASFSLELPRDESHDWRWKYGQVKPPRILYRITDEKAIVTNSNVVKHNEANFKKIVEDNLVFEFFPNGVWKEIFDYAFPGYLLTLGYNVKPGASTVVSPLDNLKNAGQIQLELLVKNLIIPGLEYVERNLRLFPDHSKLIASIITSLKNIKEITSEAIRLEILKITKPDDFNAQQCWPGNLHKLKLVEFAQLLEQNIHPWQLTRVLINMFNTHEFLFCSLKNDGKPLENWEKILLAIHCEVVPEAVFNIFATSNAKFQSVADANISLTTDQHKIYLLSNLVNEDFFKEVLRKVGHGRILELLDHLISIPVFLHQASDKLNGIVESILKTVPETATLRRQRREHKEDCNLIAITIKANHTNMSKLELLDTLISNGMPYPEKEYNLLNRSWTAVLSNWLIGVVSSNIFAEKVKADALLRKILLDPRSKQEFDGCTGGLITARDSMFSAAANQGEDPGVLVDKACKADFMFVLQFLTHSLNKSLSNPATEQESGLLPWFTYVMFKHFFVMSPEKQRNYKKELDGLAERWQSYKPMKGNFFFESKEQLTTFNNDLTKMLEQKESKATNLFEEFLSLDKSEQISKVRDAYKKYEGFDTHMVTNSVITMLKSFGITDVQGVMAGPGLPGENGEQDLSIKLFAALQEFKYRFTFCVYQACGGTHAVPVVFDSLTRRVHCIDPQRGIDAKTNTYNAKQGLGDEEFAAFFNRNKFKGYFLQRPDKFEPMKMLQTDNFKIHCGIFAATIITGIILTEKMKPYLEQSSTHPVIKSLYTQLSKDKCILPDNKLTNEYWGAFVLAYERYEAELEKQAKSQQVRGLHL